MTKHPLKGVAHECDSVLSLLEICFAELVHFLVFSFRRHRLDKIWSLKQIVPGSIVVIADISQYAFD